MTDADTSPLPWSRGFRRGVGLVILLYLAVLLLGPLTNPIGAPHLTTPLARFAAPVHQGLFLGHGYRFFGPDPGPSHTLVFEVTTPAGELIQGRLPDRDSMTPRLLYHRWFMLTETLYREGSLVPDEQQQQQIEEQYQRQIAAYRAQGNKELIQQLTLEQQAQAEMIEAARERRDGLIESIAQELLRRHGGQSVRLQLQIRELPAAEEVAAGLELTDPGLLQIIEIGTFPPPIMTEPSIEEGL